jgi:hypothetical protein
MSESTDGPEVSENDRIGAIRLEVVSSPPPAHDASVSRPAFERAKLVLDYVRALAWPLVLLILLAVYRPPLGRMAQSVAAKIESADKLSVGSFSVEVAEQARAVGNASLATSIGSLSTLAVEELMRTPRDGVMILVSTSSSEARLEFGLPSEERYAALTELVEKGFLSWRLAPTTFDRLVERVLTPSPTSRNQRGEQRRWLVPMGALSSADSSSIARQGYELTDTGRKAAEAITLAVAAQLKAP